MYYTEKNNDKGITCLILSVQASISYGWQKRVPHSPRQPRNLSTYVDGFSDWFMLSRDQESHSSCSKNAWKYAFLSFFYFKKLCPGQREINVFVAEDLYSEENIQQLHASYQGYVAEWLIVVD